MVHWLFIPFWGKRIFHLFEDFPTNQNILKGVNVTQVLRLCLEMYILKNRENLQHNKIQNVTIFWQ